MVVKLSSRSDIYTGTSYNIVIKIISYILTYRRPHRLSQIEAGKSLDALHTAPSLR